MKVNISAERFNDWLKSPLKQASEYSDWDLLDLHSKSNCKHEFYNLAIETPQELLKLWSSENDDDLPVELWDSSPMLWIYNENEKCFVLVQYYFKGDYIDKTINFLGALRSIENFKDIDNADHAIICSSFWDLSLLKINGIIRITCNDSMVLTHYHDIANELKNEACDCLVDRIVQDSYLLHKTYEETKNFCDKYFWTHVLWRDVEDSSDAIEWIISIIDSTQLDDYDYLASIGAGPLEDLGIYGIIEFISELPKKGITRDSEIDKKLCLSLQMCWLNPNREKSLIAEEKKIIEYIKYHYPSYIDGGGDFYIN